MLQSAKKIDLKTGFWRNRVKIAILILFAALFTLTTTLLPGIQKKASASTHSWDMETSTDYTYDDTKIEFSGGVAQLKTSYTPGVNWVATDGGGNNWYYRKQITIDYTKVPNTDQTDFPVLISVTDTDLRDTSNSGHVGKSNGGDILFTSSNGTTGLSHEIKIYTRKRTADRLG